MLVPPARTSAPLDAALTQILRYIDTFIDHVFGFELALEEIELVRSARYTVVY
ncbi:hypothetical protein Scep_028590 [Stephania cephalantha]|uniref:Uncharacterized protein n=1 Tax=Stephania cephalantha TaxID=152367 RepID=A0AAP0EEE1_9MAGN